jgi:purine-binding chemotaxis protein CheW
MTEIQSEHDDSSPRREYVTATISGQLCGIPVMKVQDVLGPQQITPVPLSVPEVAGSLNLRGRIVTAIDLRVRMGLPARDEDDKGMSVVVEHQNDLFSLMVDTVGEVLKLSESGFERNPPTLDALWRTYSEGVYRLESGLLVVLDVGNLLDFGADLEAA